MLEKCTKETCKNGGECKTSDDGTSYFCEYVKSKFIFLILFLKLNDLDVPKTGLDDTVRISLKTQTVTIRDQKRFDTLIIYCLYISEWRTLTIAIGSALGGICFILLIIVICVCVR